MTAEEKVTILNQNAQWREGIQLYTPPEEGEDGRRGCTDPLASNYDPVATVDNGQCYYSASSNK